MIKNVTVEQGLLDNQDGYLGLMLRKSANAYRNKMEKALMEEEMTASQFTVLSMISAFPNCSNAQVARLAYLTPQTVNLIVNKLLKMNNITKNKHPENKLIQILEITEDGTGVLNRCNEVVQKLEKQIESNLNFDEQAIVRKWLSGIIES